MTPDQVRQLQREAWEDKENKLDRSGIRKERQRMRAAWKEPFHFDLGIADMIGAALDDGRVYAIGAVGLVVGAVAARDAWRERQSRRAS